MASTITFQCYSCNQVLKVGSDKAGKKAKCIKCGTILTIPVASDEEDVEEVRSGPPRRSSARDEDEDDRPRKRRSRDDDDEDDDDRPRSRRGRNDDEDDEDRPRKRRSRDDDDEDDDDRPRSRRGRGDDDEDEDYDRPRKRSRDRDDDDDDYDRARKKKSSPWPKVGVGLLLNFISSIALIAFAGVEILFTVLFLIGVLATSGGMLDFSAVMVLIAALIFTTLEIPALVGYIFSIFAPNKKGALAFAITAVSLSGVALVVKIIWFLIPYFSKGGQIMGASLGLIGLTEAGGGFRGMSLAMPPGSSKAVIILLQVLFFAAIFTVYVIYPMYLAAISKQLKERYLQGGCARVLGFGAAAMGAKIVVFVLIFAIGESASAGMGAGTAKGMMVLFCVLRIAASAVLLVFALMYMRLLQEIRSRLD